MLPSRESGRLRVVLVSTRNPLNIGAAARAMSNFGFQHLRVVNPFEPSFREAKSAVGAADILANAQQYSSVADAVADCSLVVGTSAVQNRAPQVMVKRLDSATAPVRAHLKHARAAILFGSEKRGLSNEDLSYCHWLVHIPTRDEHSSMNLGQAVAVCLYELARQQDRSAASVMAKAATAGQLERVTELLIDALQTSGYLSSTTGATSEAKVRRLVWRLGISGEDAETLLGMLRQIGWKLNQSNNG